MVYWLLLFFLILPAASEARVWVLRDVLGTAWRRVFVRMISACPSPLGTRLVGPEWRAGPGGAGHTTSCLKVSCVADAGWIEAAASIPEPPSGGQGTKPPRWQQ